MPAPKEPILSERNHAFILLGITGLVTACYVKILIAFDEMAHLGMSALFALACGSLLWDQRASIRLNGHSKGVLWGILGLLMTLAVAGFALYQSSIDRGPNFELLKHPGLSALVRLLPILGAIVIALLADGWNGLRQFWRVILILVALGLPGTLAVFLPDISPLTARLSTSLLWYLGFDVIRDGLKIFLEGGGVEVYRGCSGMESVAYLVGLSFLCLIMFPVTGFKRYLVPLLGILIGFVVNGVRVSLMAVLAASGNKAAFDYWHVGEGSLVFGAIAVILFGLVYMGVQMWDQKQRQRRYNSSGDKSSSLHEVSPDLLTFLETEDDN